MYLYFQFYAVLPQRTGMYRLITIVLRMRFVRLQWDGRTGCSTIRSVQQNAVRFYIQSSANGLDAEMFLTELFSKPSGTILLPWKDQYLPYLADTTGEVFIFCVYGGYLTLTTIIPIQCWTKTKRVGKANRITLNISIVKTLFIRIFIFLYESVPFIFFK